LAIFNNNKLKLTNASTFPDFNDDFPREPFFVELVERSSNQTFTIGTTHTQPSSAEEEIGNFGQVLNWARRVFMTPNVMLVGDYNADGTYFDADRWDEVLFNGVIANNYTLLSPNNQDRTLALKNYNYDKVVSSKTFHQQSVDVGGQLISKAFHNDKSESFSALLDEILTEGCDTGYVPSSACSGRGEDIEEDYRIAVLEMSDHYPVEYSMCLGEGVGGDVATTEIALVANVSYPFSAVFDSTPFSYSIDKPTMITFFSDANENDQKCNSCTSGKYVDG